MVQEGSYDQGLGASAVEMSAAVALAAEAPPSADGDGDREPCKPPLEDAPASSDDGKAPAYRLDYPPFWVGRAPNRRLLVQLVVASALLMLFCLLYVGAHKPGAW